MAVCQTRPVESDRHRVLLLREVVSALVQRTTTLTIGKEEEEVRAVPRGSILPRRRMGRRIPLEAPTTLFVGSVQAQLEWQRPQLGTKWRYEPMWEEQRSRKRLQLLLACRPDEQTQLGKGFAREPTATTCSLFRSRSSFWLSAGSCATPR